MLFQSPSFKRKSPEELIRQNNQVSVDLGVGLIPSSEEKEDAVINFSPVEKIKNLYPKRYEIYLKLLRANKNKNTDILTVEEKESFQTWTRAMNNLNAYLAGNTNESGVKLRPHQEKMLTVLRDFFEKGGREGYIVLPTQVGKTAIAAKLASILQLKTLGVTERRFDVLQMEKDFKKFGVDEVSTNIVNEDNTNDPVGITTYSSLRSHVKNKRIDPKECELFLLNEAHHALGHKTQRVVEQFDRALTIGLTATPDFSEDKGLWWILPQKIYEMSLNEAIHEGLLKNTRVFVAEVDKDLSGVKVKATGDFDAKELEQTINIKSLNQGATEVYKEFFSEELALCYCTGVEHAKALANEFTSQGIPAVALSGTTSKKDYEDAVAKFNRGEIKVICSADLLIESFSEPKASVCLNLRPTLSMRLAKQRGGRVLALDEENKDKEAIIVDFLYKSKKQLITYYDVLGDAQVSHLDEEVTAKKEDKFEKIQKGIFAGGIKVHTKVEEVARFLKDERPEIKPKEKKTEDETKWDTMLRNTGRLIRESNIKQEIEINTELLSVEKPRHKEDSTLQMLTDYFYSKISVPVKKILQNEGWVLGGEFNGDYVDSFLPTGSFEGPMSFQIGKIKRDISHGNDEDMISDRELILKMIQQKNIKPLPQNESLAFLGWLFASPKMKKFRKGFNSLFVPVQLSINKKGCYYIYSMPYRKEDYSGEEHDVIIVEYCDDIEKGIDKRSFGALDDSVLSESLIVSAK